MLTVSSRSLVMTQSMSPFMATSLNNLTLKGTFLSLTMMPCASRSLFQSIASRWIEPSSALRLTKRLALSVAVEGQSQTVNQLQVLPGGHTNYQIARSWPESDLSPTARSSIS